jgi:uncharacterized protein YjaG (DUF416 family)
MRAALFLKGSFKHCNFIDCPVSDMQPEWAAFRKATQMGYYDGPIFKA